MDDTTAPQPDPAWTLVRMTNGIGYFVNETALELGVRARKGPFVVITALGIAPGANPPVVLEHPRDLHLGVAQIVALEPSMALPTYDEVKAENEAQARIGELTRGMGPVANGAPVPGPGVM